MKYTALFALSLCSLAMLTSCKSQESAYRQAYERAKAQEQNAGTQTVSVAPQPAQTITPVSTTPVTPVEDDNTPVRTITGGITVVNGEPLKAFSVVVGSFINQTNAESLMTTLRNRGYAARVVRTNETINGQTGWYRVIASSFDSKAQAAQSKNTLRDSYPDAWLLSR